MLSLKTYYMAVCKALRALKAMFPCTQGRDTVLLTSLLSSDGITCY